MFDTLYSVMIDYTGTPAELDTDLLAGLTGIFESREAAIRLANLLEDQGFGVKIETLEMEVTS